MSCVAVIDVETTGLFPYRHDRVVELAAVVINESGQVIREYETLLNPERDIGTIRIHGLMNRDILHAPRFADVVGSFLQFLDGCVAFAGHNVRFDHMFCKVEFERLGAQFPDGPKLCTMRLAGGGNLASVCADYAIDFDGPAHSAACDARATALLLAKLLNDEPIVSRGVFAAPAISWPKLPSTETLPVRRGEYRKSEAATPTYLQKLDSLMQMDQVADSDDQVAQTYLSLLHRILEDRQIEPSEGEALFDLAEHLRLSRDRVRELHWAYLVQLCEAALADGIVTNPERQDLQLVAGLLGIGAERIDEALTLAANDSRAAMGEVPSNVRIPIEDLAGKRVCFTGDSTCRVNGTLIDREKASQLAAAKGLTAADSVTKKLDLLVVADPLTQSGKAKKAKRYGIRIIYEPAFWQTVGVKVDGHG